MQMNMILTYYTFQNLNIKTIAGLPYQISASHLNLTPQNLKPIFRAPNQMNVQLMRAMAAYSFILHPQNLKEICRS